MNTFHLRILASDQMFFEGACENLVAPCADGSFGVQANHSNMISAVTPGELHYRPAERPEEIDANRARRAADRAKEAMLQKRSIQEYRVAQYNLARAMSRLQVHSDFERK